ncbi:YadA C-terminal domain-containing protein [Vibrio sp. VPAP30]|uniref:YadA C-terminal domain-containing protein n=1 Tax=Vibrio sp. VPAP30 TaxID=1647102 RepID=UPI00065971E2|nr:YadA C-terminal domain-containing protein [Vibrio sp. VPAP30]KLN63439.1 hypothetical protein ZX61_18070 [Vibrio sp. VPAP30]
MKKTILALTVTTLFSGAAMAENHGTIDVTATDFVREAGSFTIVQNKILDKQGKEVGTFKVDHKDSVAVEFTSENREFKDARFVVNDGRIEVRATDSNDKFHTASINVTTGGSDSKAAVDRSTATKIVNGAGLRKEGSHFVATKGQYKGYTIEEGTGYVRDDKGRKVSKVAVDDKGNVYIDASDAKKPDDASKNNNAEKRIDDSNWTPNNDVMEAETAIEEAEAYANNWAAYAETQFKQEVARLDAKIDSVEGRVSNGAAMAGAMTQMQFGHDGFGVGAGVANFNGSNAIAVGVGYAFGNEKQWMAKGSFGYAKSNKGNKSADTMAAAGLTYSFK